MIPLFQSTLGTTSFHLKLQCPGWLGIPGQSFLYKKKDDELLTPGRFRGVDGRRKDHFILKRSKTLQWKKGGIEGRKILLSPLLFTKAVGKSRREE
jgi:hypothetical protein